MLWYRTLKHIFADEKMRRENGDKSAIEQESLTEELKNKTIAAAQYLRDTGFTMFAVELMTGFFELYPNE